MEGLAVADKRRSRRPQSHGAFHRALINAKVKKQTVKLTLAIETDYSDAMGVCQGTVKQVEPDSTLFVIQGREIWILEAFLVSVEPLVGGSS